MAIKLNGSTSGSVALDAPADTSPSGTDVTLTLPTSAGSSGQYLQTNGSGTLSWQTVSSSNLTRVNSQSLSGVSSVLFHTIPAEARVIYLVLDQASAPNGTSGAFLHIRLGTGSSTDATGIESTGYQSNGAFINTASSADSFGSTTGFNLDNADTGNNHSGVITIVNQSGNVWCSSGTTTVNNSGFMNAGRKELSGTLTKVQFLTTAGNFDNGTVSLLYEVV